MTAFQQPQVIASETVSDDVSRVDDLIFDVGLHRGEDTALYLALGFRVVAFEADPDHAAACRARFSREIAEQRLTIVEAAIAEPGVDEITFYRSPALSAWGTTDAEWVGRREALAEFQPVTVPACDFAQAIRTFGVPHFLKIDIEGADRLCLEALEEFSQRPRYLSIESEKFDWAALEGEFDVFERLGYGRFAVVQQANLPGRLLRTVDRAGNPVEFRFEADSSGGFGVDVGPWLDRDRALKRYRGVFRRYRRYGEGSFLRRFRAGRIFLARLPRYTGRSMPGWYDTHAMLVE